MDYFRRIILDYSTLKHPLTNLVRKVGDYKWSNEFQKALKTVLM